MKYRLQFHSNKKWYFCLLWKIKQNWKFSASKRSIIFWNLKLNIRPISYRFYNVLSVRNKPLWLYRRNLLSLIFYWRPYSFQKPKSRKGALFTMCAIETYRLDYFIVCIQKPCQNGRNIIDALEREFSSHGILNLDFFPFLFSWPP